MVIRSWLGHGHLDTTNHYGQANLEANIEALKQADPNLRPANSIGRLSRCEPRSCLASCAPFINSKARKSF